MLNKHFFITITLLLVFVGTFHPIKGIMGIEFTSILPTGKLVYEVGKYGYDYYYNTEENQALLEKHLQPHSYVATGCKRNLSRSCMALANYYKKFEEFHKIDYLKAALEKVTNFELIEFIEKDLVTAQEEKIKMKLPDNKGSYFQSLSSEEKNKILELAKLLITENNGLDCYAEELTYIYNSLNK